MSSVRAQLRTCREERLLACLDGSFANLVHAADMLHEMLIASSPSPGLARSLVVAEQNSGRVRRELVELLAGRSVGAIESEDLYGLGLAVARVVSEIEKVADLHVRYHLEEPPASAPELATLLLDAARLLSEAWARARDLRAPTLYTQGVKRAERDADERFRAALAALIQGSDDPLRAIKHKDVLESLERAVDAEKRTADLLDGLVARNA